MDNENPIINGLGILGFSLTISESHCQIKILKAWKANQTKVWGAKIPDRQQRFWADLLPL